MSSPEWKQALTGSLSAVIFGSIQPVYAFIIGGMIAAFYLQDNNEMQTIINHYALIFLLYFAGFHKYPSTSLQEQV